MGRARIARSRKIVEGKFVIDARQAAYATSALSANPGAEGRTPRNSRTSLLGFRRPARIQIDGPGSPVAAVTPSGE